MIAFPNAKINLGLNIIEKRKDGYHNIESVFYPVMWQDVLEIIEYKKLEFSTSGIQIPGNPNDNLCVKAYKMLNKDYQLPPVKIHLHKNIPIGGGLGGGSADGSFCLKMLSEKFHLMLNDEILEDYAAQLGSDCPFFIANDPCLVAGRGEVFSNIDLSLSGKSILLVNPQIHISTAEAYAGVKPGKPESSIKEIIETVPVQEWKSVLRNDFELSILPKYPLIGELKGKLYDSGATYVSMTGSGATVYAIYDNEIPDLHELKQGQNIIWKGKLTH
jgi:4-diphosphocytidyl-2-C-methyl-D-erythritol kinase